MDTTGIRSSIFRFKIPSELLAKLDQYREWLDAEYDYLKQKKTAARRLGDPVAAAEAKKEADLAYEHIQILKRERGEVYAEIKRLRDLAADEAVERQIAADEMKRVGPTSQRRTYKGIGGHKKVSPAEKAAKKAAKSEKDRQFRQSCRGSGQGGGKKE